MLEKISLTDLQKEISGDWGTINLPNVNQSSVHFRAMTNTATPWHVHEQSDQLFYVLSGKVNLETDDSQQEINANEFVVVRSKTRHRTHTNTAATLLIIDNISEQEAQTLQPEA